MSSIGSQVASGELCRACLIPLDGRPPKHTRLCPVCYAWEMEDGHLDLWELGYEPADVEEVR